MQTGYVFTAHAGKPVAPDRMTRLFSKLVAASGLPPVTLHGLRHGGAATLALAAGTDLKVGQDHLGQSTVVLGADTYTSVLPGPARAAAVHTAALLFPDSPLHCTSRKPAASGRASAAPGLGAARYPQAPTRGLTPDSHNRGLALARYPPD